MHIIIVLNLHNLKFACIFQYQLKYLTNGFIFLFVYVIDVLRVEKLIELYLDDLFYIELCMPNLFSLRYVYLEYFFSSVCVFVAFWFVFLISH